MMLSMYFIAAIEMETETQGDKGNERKKERMKGSSYIVY